MAWWGWALIIAGAFLLGGAVAYVALMLYLAQGFRW
jgi:hypothetical protein